MSIDVKKSPPGAKGLEERNQGDRLELAATGMEAEFALVVDDQQVKPEDLFGDPRAFVRGPLMHRQGTSYHIPTGGAVYFDTGVVDVASEGVCSLTGTLSPRVTCRVP